jgi:hypothetical protein
MSLKYSSGDFEKLKALLAQIFPDNWTDVNANTYQLKHDSVVVNFFTTTGTIQFQGNPEKARKYEAAVSEILTGKATPEHVVSIEKQEEVAALTEEPGQQGSTPVEESKKFLSQEFDDSEIVIGLVGAIGTQYSEVKKILVERLTHHFRYDVEEIKISNDIINSLPIYSAPTGTGSPNFERIKSLMSAGNEARKKSGNNAILALGAISLINKKRESGKFRKA